MRHSLALLLLLLAGCASDPPADLWSKAQRFPGCPSRPSCVSSIATDDRHRIAPLRYDGDAAAARASLSAVITAMPGARIELEDARYLHAVFVTRLLRFRDDVELLVRDGGVIDVRSISRFGYSDLGANRRRVEELRRRFDAR